MKPFIFENQEYSDLNTLGVAFVHQFDLALKSIQEKSFLKFIKHFKEYKKSIKNMLYQSRYIQNALSMIIYLITEEHILYIGHKRYNTIQDCLKDVKKNLAIAYFAEDHGFSNTILPDLSDEKLKADIKTFEEAAKDELALTFLENNYHKDSIETVDLGMKKVQQSNEPFKAALKEFKSQDVQLALAQKYSLKDVVELRKRNCPVFKGISLLRESFEDSLDILENAFYMSLLDIWRTCKYKGAAKGVKRKLKDFTKAYKRFPQMSFQQKLSWYEKFHTLYLEWVDYYKEEKIFIEDEMDIPNIPYCDTYISSNVKEERELSRDTIEKPYQPIIKEEYNLKKLDVSIRNHGFFAYWCMFLTVLVACGYVFLGLLPMIKSLIFDAISKIVQTTLTKEAFEEIVKTPLLIHILFFVGVGIALGVAIFIFILKCLARGKYNALCRLSYYRKNEFILSDKEIEEYERLKEREGKYAKKIDRFYRFYGGVAMAGFSLAVTVFMLVFIQLGVCFFKDSIAINIQGLFKEKLYFLAIPPVLSMLLGFLRHKKTSWSIIGTYLLSIVLSVGLVFLSTML